MHENTAPVSRRATADHGTRPHVTDLYAAQRDRLGRDAR